MGDAPHRPLWLMVKFGFYQMNSMTGDRTGRPYENGGKKPIITEKNVRRGDAPHRPRCLMVENGFDLMNSMAGDRTGRPYELDCD